MLISWNIRELNKGGKIREVRAHLSDIKPDIFVLIETRGKAHKTSQIRNNMYCHGDWLDNYADHPNGRIWIHWDNTKIDIRFVQSSNQFIHCGVYDNKGAFMYWLTTVYAHNQLHNRKILWNEINQLQVQGAWCVLGDFNNVLKSQDHIGGRMVTEAEFVDLQLMMQQNGLTEMDSIGENYTWSNKHATDTIYSTRIDRVLDNTEWYLAHMDTTLKIIPPSISDHAMLHLFGKENKRNYRRHFKFCNCIIAGPPPVEAHLWLFYCTSSRDYRRTSEVSARL